MSKSIIEAINKHTKFYQIDKNIFLKKMKEKDMWTKNRPFLRISFNTDGRSTDET